VWEEIYGLSPEAMNTLMVYNFPGNIRELENIIEYATVVCKNSLIRIQNLPENLLRAPDSKNNTVTKETSEKVFSIETMEKNIILETLRKNNWNRKATAAQMGIHSSTLWRKIKRLNLKIPEQDGRSRNK